MKMTPELKQLRAWVIAYNRAKAGKFGMVQTAHLNRFILRFLKMDLTLREQTVINRAREYALKNP